MRDFYVVLGMDWLSHHRSTLDCYKTEVKLHRTGKLEVKFKEIRRELVVFQYDLRLGSVEDTV